MKPRCENCGHAGFSKLDPLLVVSWIDAGSPGYVQDLLTLEGVYGPYIT